MQMSFCSLHTYCCYMYDSKSQYAQCPIILLATRLHSNQKSVHFTLYSPWGVDYFSFCSLYLLQSASSVLGNCWDIMHKSQHTRLHNDTCFFWPRVVMKLSRKVDKFSRTKTREIACLSTVLNYSCNIIWSACRRPHSRIDTTAERTC